MRGRVVRCSIVSVALMVMFSGLGWLPFSPCSAGELMALDDIQGTIDVSEEVREDANSLALELFGDSLAECNRFVDNFLEVYSAAVNKDFLLIFNSGGVGGSEIGPEWGSIVAGIEEELRKLGHTTLLLAYVRTPPGSWGFIKEIREGMLFYPSKAKPLASQIGFLTGHIESVRVILMGESSGGVFSNEVMGLLEANPWVFSIQTGIPFTYDGAVSDRSLVISDNGITPDTLSSGDFWAILGANLWRIPTYRPEEGHFLLYIRTPGHIYTWDHPGVNSKISSFLQENFGTD